jgi:O-antigen ligase
MVMSSAKPDIQSAATRTVRIILLSLVLAVNVCLGGAIFEAPAFDLVLQLVACAALIWCILDRTSVALRAPAVSLIGLLSFAFLAVLIQLLPLPASLWETLPGRAEPSEVMRLVGATEKVLPLSLAPQETLAALFWMLPPAAVLVAVVTLDTRSAVLTARWSVPALAAASVVLGIAQVVTVDVASLYLHEGPAMGHAAGFFQVVNYQPTLLLMAIPFVAVQFSRLGGRFRTGDAYLAQGVMLATLLLVLAAGVAAAGSMAGYVLILPVVMASIPIALHGGVSSRVFLGMVIAILCLGSAAFYVAGSPMLTGIGTTDLGSGPLSRVDSWSRAATMAGDYFPVGSGVGAFRDAFSTYEDPSLVSDFFVTHAHNDYLEVIVELGLPGMLLLVGVVGWWAVMTFVIWRRPLEEGLRTRKAASVAVAVVLLHSLVDSPARTEAIACLAAFCLGLMALSPAKRSGRSVPVTAHRHIEL